MTQRSTFFGRRALLILVIVFFLVPFALRGARVAVQNMKNDVKDWLPSDFPETAELDWFREHFLGEQFVVISWEGCGAGGIDERLKLFLAKLQPEVPPAAPADRDEESGESAADASEPVADGPAIVSPLQRLDGEDRIGDQLGLFAVRDDYYDWGGQREKWLQGNDGTGARWYYLTPDGDLFRWDGTDAIMAAAWRQLVRRWSPPKLSGELVHSFGADGGAWYYERPRRLRAQLFKTVTTGPAILASLTGPRGVLADDPDEAKRRLTGTVFGPDGEQTCLVVTLTDAARRDLHQVLGRGMLGRPRGRLYEIAEEVNLKPEQLRLGGPPVDNVAIDEEGTITLVRLIGFSIVLGLTLSMICFQSVTATLMVFFVGGISAVLSLALVYWGGSSVDAIMMSMPSLVYVLGLSGAAHIINYYHAAVAEFGHVGAPERAIRHGWKPALLCNVTTAIGLASLATSDLTPIRKFGIFSAIGVLATLLILFTYLPASLQLFPQTPKVPRERSEDSPWLERHLGGFWNRLGSFCIRRHVLVSLGCMAVICGVGMGVVRTQTSVNMLKMFHSKAKIIQDYVWLETHLGRLVPMELVLKVSPEALLPSARELESQGEPAPSQQYQLTFLERLELTDRVQRVIEREFGPTGQNLLGRGMSAATFAPLLPAPRGDTTTFARRGATNRQLEAHRAEFLASDYLREDTATGSELWRISLRVAATKGVDYGAFVADLKAAVEPVLAAYEFRDTVLRAVVEQREGKRPAGAKVLLLGMSSAAMADQLNADDTKDGQPADTAAPERGDREILPVEGSKIFARTLHDLLQTSRLRVAAHIADVTPLPDNWTEIVANYDCVVLLSDTGYDLAALQESAQLLIDARGVHTAAPAATAVTSTAPGTPAAPRFAAVYTGIVPIVYKAQRTLLDSLVQSTFWSFITITPLMMLIARNIAGGLVAMLPNVLPVLVVFGAMGWMGINVDVGSMMTASVALGVAVDDTIHYLNWFREELDQTGDRKAAILAAYRHCATPTLQAAIISGLGLSVFALSTFTPTQRFGFLMLAILWTGMIAELVFFPALLAGPLGRIFKPRRPIRHEHHDGRHARVILRTDPGAPAVSLAPRGGTSYSE
ncbi:MAG: MMPL family transporter [Pirellulaceae bacterium]|nr:MMPL family transporter [Pirellulaceae bacterium]